MIKLEQALLALYTYTVIPLGNDRYEVVFPDLPGCVTYVAGAESIHTSAMDAKEQWMVNASDDGRLIPPPSFKTAHG